MDRGHFPSTHWTLVERAASQEEPVRRPALEEFLRRYLPALRAHVAAWGGLTATLADDLVQGFVCSRLLERNLLARVGREGGRFRTFLLTTLDRYVIDQLRSERSRRPPAGAAAPPDDEVPAPVSGASEEFDAAWARAVVAEAVWLTRKECDGSGRADLWEVFRVRLLGPAFDGADPEPHDALALRVGAGGADRSANLLVTAKRMFRRNLRRAVRDYALGEEDADDELAQLLATLQRVRRGTPR